MSHERPCSEPHELSSNMAPTDLQLESERLVVVFGFFDLLRQGTRN